ncbi:MAG: DUF202 domain-containing protein [Ktedonobacteraceae bacterium]|nr:DUF202 domain-containing protein [Ktedonobacteraceae bacterium]MBO0790728.1 DUF202 domain-containing protein [Ktedonobacteraceae bacterium]
MDQTPGPAERSQDQQRSAQKRTNEHLANDRTGLAWIRTGLSIIGIGFVISRFGLLIRAQSGSDQPSSPIHYSSILGLALVGAGILTLVLALVNYLRIHRAIEKNKFPVTPHFVAVLMGLLAILGILLFIYMWGVT